MEICSICKPYVTYVILFQACKDHNDKIAQHVLQMKYIFVIIQRIRHTMSTAVRTWYCPPKNATNNNCIRAVKLSHPTQFIRSQ